MDKNRAATKKRPWFLSRLTVTHNVPDLVTVFVLGLLVALWAARAGGSFSFLVLLACEVSLFAYYAAGSLLSALPAIGAGILFELPLRLILGYAAINTTMLVLAWVSPLGMTGNFLSVVALLLLAQGKLRHRVKKHASTASYWAMAICFVGATLWCQDSLDPTVQFPQGVVFKPWVDSFYHAIHIRIFADSHGAATIEDFRLSGVPARLYHYGVYLLPAFIKNVSGLHSYTAFTGILAPVGVLFTGFAAYSFVGAMWGPWPAVAATAALMVLPDGAQQGMDNPFMSYHWLTQISPSATYGLALLAVAWLFVIQGCVRGNRWQLLLGWIISAILVAYKLHYVIASSLLLLLVPALFFRAELGKLKRSLWALSACAFYGAALVLGQKIPGVPLIRFDGSGVGEILHLIGTFGRPGSISEYAQSHTGREVSVLHNLGLGVPYVLMTVFGVTLPLFLTVLVALRKRIEPIYLAFPLLLLVNFLLMFFGLALDFSSSTPDELSHRPLMIVYFFVVTWLGGALGWLTFQGQKSGGLRRQLMLCLVAIALLVPASLGRGVQLMWVMHAISPIRVPHALLHMTDYLLTHSQPGEVIQDSQFDRYYIIAALSERRSFVAHPLTLMPYRADMVERRSDAVDRLMTLNLPKLVKATAGVFGLRYFILQRGSQVRWPQEMLDEAVFQEGAFSVFDMSKVSE